MRLNTENSYGTIERAKLFEEWKLNFDRLVDAMAPTKKGPFRAFTRGLHLENHVFERTIFGTAQHGPPLGQTYLLKNVTFDRCVTDTGPFWFTKGWDLSDVKIDKMKAWRVMINAQVVLRNVKILSYAKAGRLEILPDISTEHLPSRQFDTSDYGLDVSGHKGDLRIMGVNASAVEIDPSRQYRLRLPDPDVKAKDLRTLDPDSFIAIGIDQMSSMRVRDAVFSLPRIGDRYLSREQEALEVLTSMGIAF